MNKEAFLRHIEESRDCEPSRLDSAVGKGLRRARNDRLDAKKLFTLAAAGLFTLAGCFTLTLPAFQTAGEKYYRSRQREMPGGAEALDGYVKIIAGSIKYYLGGK